MLERHPLMRKDGVVERYTIPILSKNVEQRMLKDIITADIRGDDAIEYGKDYTSLPIGKYWMKFTYDYVNKEYPDKLPFFLNFVTKAEITFSNWRAALQTKFWDEWIVPYWTRA